LLFVLAVSSRRRRETPAFLRLCYPTFHGFRLTAIHCSLPGSVMKLEPITDPFCMRHYGAPIHRGNTGSQFRHFPEGAPSSPQFSMFKSFLERCRNPNIGKIC
jgi:hypothetical protein